METPINEEKLKDVKDTLKFIDENAVCLLCGKVGCRCEVDPEYVLPSIY